MHHEAKCGIRPLSMAEIAMVAGGDDVYEGEEIVVTAKRIQAVSWDGGSSFGFSDIQWRSGVDYCGSGSFNAPDWIGDIYIGGDCYAHDVNYGPDSTVDRAAADAQLASDIYMTLVDGGMSDTWARFWSGAYHLGVRLGGGAAYQGQGSPE